MRLISTYLFSAYFACNSLLATEANTLSLGDAYQQALKYSETLAIEQSKVSEGENYKKRTLGAFFPRVSFQARQFVLTENSQSQSKPWLFFRIRQPVITGLQEYYGYTKAELELEKQKKIVTWQKHNLLLETADAYFSLQRAKNMLLVKNRLIDLTETRVAALSQRRRLGKSGRSELLTARAQIARLKAEKNRLLTDERIAQEKFFLLTGIKTLKFPEKSIETREPLAKVPPTSEIINKRIDIQIEEKNIEIARKNLSLARGEYFPNIYLQGDYFLQRGGSDAAVTSSQGDWYVQAVAEFPIFSGLSTFYKVKEAKEQIKQAELMLHQRKRRVTSEVVQARESLKLAEDELQAYELALAEAQSSYNAVLREYNFRRVTNLEVLSAMLELQTMREALADVNYRVRLNYIWLQIALGYPPDKILKNLN